MIDQRPKSAPLSGELIVSSAAAAAAAANAIGDHAGCAYHSLFVRLFYSMRKALSDQEKRQIYRLHGAPCRDSMTDVMDVCDLSSRQHAALKTVIKVTSRGKGGSGSDKVRRSLCHV